MSQTTISNSIECISSDEQLPKFLQIPILEINGVTIPILEIYGASL